MTARKFKPDEVVFTLTPHPEDLQLEGHYGNEELESKIRADVEDGNEWAWAYVIVTASWGGFTGRDNLGGCSYKDETDFRTNSGYFADMRERAVEDLLNEIKTAGWDVTKE